MNDIEKPADSSKSAVVLCCVVFNGASEGQIRFGNNDSPNVVLKVGGEYRVAEKEVHSWYTRIRLVGIDKWFNDASFSYT